MHLIVCYWKSPRFAFFTVCSTVVAVPSNGKSQKICGTTITNIKVTIAIVDSFMCITLPPTFSAMAIAIIRNQKAKFIVKPIGLSNLQFKSSY